MLWTKIKKCKTDTKIFSPTSVSICKCDHGECDKPNILIIRKLERILFQAVEKDFIVGRSRNAMNKIKRNYYKISMITQNFKLILSFDANILQFYKRTRNPFWKRRTF